MVDVDVEILNYLDEFMTLETRLQWGIMPFG